MCSIVITFNEKQPKILSAMASAVRHRGPDTFEICTTTRHGVGACRLSIFGDAAAPMIFHDEQSGLIVLLNGEIYNYRENWEQLSKIGHAPTTDLEAELIANLYSIYGSSFASHLKGMFAITIIDDSKLILARDRLGIKPLYYYQSGTRILVCSEIKGILRHPNVSPVLNIAALEETFVFGYVYSQEHTVFKGIRQVPPGAVLSFNSTGTASFLNFGDLPSAHYHNGKKELDYQSVLIGTRQLLIEAIERMFKHGAMGKGVYLSGGLDSTTIAYIARNELGFPVKTFTLADVPDTPDMLAARSVAACLQTEHREYLISKKDYWRWLPDYIAHYESLMAGGVYHIQGGLAFHILSKFVSEHVQVAFSGEGADEIFGGYYWIYTHPLGFSDRIKSRLSDLGNNERMANLVASIFPEPENEMLYRQNLFNCLLRGALSNYHLQSVDRSAGAFGFEIRPLYLDDQLSQWAMSLPIEYKVPDKMTTKMVLRDAFRGEFERCGMQAVTSRQKMGMPSAIERLDAEVSREVDRVVSDDELQKHPLRHLIGSKFGLLLFDLFEQIFFNGWDHHSDSPPPGSIISRVWPQRSA